MRRVRIGISVGHDQVRLLAVRGSRVTVVAAAQLASEGELEETLSGLLCEAKLPRFPQPHATLVLGPSRSQLRELTGLPESRDPRLVSEAIRHDPARFFLRNGRPIVTTRVRVVAPGIAWAGALDELAVHAVQRACTAAGVRLESAAPLLVALAHQLQDGRIVWPDGDVAGELEVRGGVAVGALRRASTAQERSHPPALPTLSALGTPARDTPDAYAAARFPSGEPVAIRFGAGDVSAWRIAAAAAALMVTLSLGVVLPVRRSRAAEHAARAELDRGAAATRSAASQTAELLAVTAALQEVADFAGERRSAVMLVAGLSRALPEGSAVVSIRADSAGGSLVVLAPRAVDVLTEVERVPEIGDAALTGAVTRELVGDRRLERVGVRFGWRRKGARR